MMFERIRRLGDRSGATRVLRGPTNDSSANGSMAFVITPSGQREPLPIAGLRVGDVRARLAGRLNLDPQAQAMIGQQNVDDDVIVKPGEYLYFRRPAGEKGARAHASANRGAGRANRAR